MGKSLVVVARDTVALVHELQGERDRQINGGDVAVPLVKVRLSTGGKGEWFPCVNRFLIPTERLLDHPEVGADEEALEVRMTDFEVTNATGQFRPAERHSTRAAPGTAHSNRDGVERATRARVRSGHAAPVPAVEATDENGWVDAPPPHAKRPLTASGTTAMKREYMAHGSMVLAVG